MKKKTTKKAKRRPKKKSNLVRLRASLRGPEGVLDKGDYSRPFPPRSRIKRPT